MKNLKEIEIKIKPNKKVHQKIEQHERRLNWLTFILCIIVIFIVVSICLV